MFRAHRVVRTSVAAAAIAAALFTATSCSEAQKAIDCIELGTQLANDISNLQGVLNDPQAASESLDNIADTLKKATEDIDSQEVNDAASELLARVESMSRQAAAGELPAADTVSLLQAGAETITNACTS
ncbi:MAG TPA: hypothetical protein VLH10_21915 [Yinghuangia sp.]|uniref:hypothetical protein n=1 Tax=Yinghuangia sp. YIM S10712 TaxID=3436930 RepID=UPI002B893E66|nr:hypothetical protein [Yinghuangia sp.]